MLFRDKTMLKEGDEKLRERVRGRGRGRVTEIKEEE